MANKTSSIDVDKFDYLKRDSLNVLGKSVFDHSRFMKFSRIIDNEICYKAPADQSNIYEVCPCCRFSASGCMANLDVWLIEATTI